MRVRDLAAIASNFALSPSLSLISDTQRIDKNLEHLSMKWTAEYQYILICFFYPWAMIYS